MSGDVTAIRVGLPLPAGTIGAVMAAVGAMWPDAQVVMSGPLFRAGMLTMTVPDGRAAAVDDAELGAIADGAAGGGALVSRVGGDGVSLVLPEDARETLAEVAFAYLTGFGGTNYVEQKLMLAEPFCGHEQMVFTVGWADKSTPHELREAAEGRVGGLEAQVAELKKLVSDLADVARDEVAESPWLAHKHGVPALIARAVEAVDGTARELECGPGCGDCAAWPQDLRDPLPEAAWEGHRPTIDVEQGRWACSCGDWASEGLQPGDGFSGHVRQAWGNNSGSSDGKGI